MLKFLGSPKTLCDGMTRRDLLHLGGLGAFGLPLNAFFRLQETRGESSEAAKPRFGQAKSCILIHLVGAPPQHETFDPKPEAPVEIQGELGAISTRLPGVREFLLPVFDQAFSALIADLNEQGMLDEALVVCISEHGRTPKISTKVKGGGREHWSRAYCSLMAGGGAAAGRVVGKTDAIGGDVAQTPVSPKDVLATSFHLLGIDPHTLIRDRQNRPLPVAGDGALRAELLA